MQILQPNTDMNTRVLKNEATDFTTFVTDHRPWRQDPHFLCLLAESGIRDWECRILWLPKPERRLRDQLGLQHNVSVPGGRTRPSRSPVDCKNGPFLTNLQPRLLLVRVVEGRAPETVEVKAIGISDNPPLYRLLADGKTYGLNVKTTGLPAGQYLATTFDDSGQIPAFDVQFTLR